MVEKRYWSIILENKDKRRSWRKEEEKGIYKEKVDYWKLNDNLIRRCMNKDKIKNILKNIIYKYGYD